MVVDLTITSPPYDDLRTYNCVRGIKSKFNGYVFPFGKIARELFRVTKPGGIVVWIVGDATIAGSETGTSFRLALHFMECGFNLFDTMIYAKPPRGAVGNNKTYWQSFEYMFIPAMNTCSSSAKANQKQSTCSAIGKTKNREKETMEQNASKTEFCSKLNAVVMVNMAEEQTSGNITSAKDTPPAMTLQHPAIFPEKLARDHILSWSNPGNLSYDPMMGSGTVAKKCVFWNTETSIKPSGIFDIVFRQHSL